MTRTVYGAEGKLHREGVYDLDDRRAKSFLARGLAVFPSPRSPSGESPSPASDKGKGAAATVAMVLRSGGEYRPEHVARLAEQIRAYLPGVRIVCLSDVDVPVERMPLHHGWPGWWSKMNLFAPEIRGDLLYFDLDTTIVGDLTDIAAVNRLTIMRDVYRPNGLQSSMMFLPEAARAEVWRAWIARPDCHMRGYRAGGDQAFLETLWKGRAAIWQDDLPGQIVSHKVHCRDGVPGGARVVIFHGKPRPWEIA